MVLAQRRTGEEEGERTGDGATEDRAAEDRGAEDRATEIEEGGTGEEEEFTAKTPRPRRTGTGDGGGEMAADRESEDRNFRGPRGGG